MFRSSSGRILFSLLKLQFKTFSVLPEDDRMIYDRNTLESFKCFNVNFRLLYMCICWCVT